MSNRLHWFKGRPGRRLLLALVLSLLVHAWLVGGLKSWLPDDDRDEADLIRVELAPLPAPKPEIPPPPIPPQPVPEPQPVKPQVAKHPVPPVPELPAQPAAGVSPEPPAPIAVAEPAAPVAAEPVTQDPVAEEIPTPPPQEEEPPPKVPRHVEIDYQVVRKGGVAAIERHRYRAQEDGSYSLSSIAEPKGLLALALSELVQRSEGMITPRGLKPSSFLYQYGKNPDKAQRATFDWQGGKLAMEAGSRRQTVELQEGTQDLMSFMYQFMFVPPLQDMNLAVTNGKKLKLYHYGFEGEETLTTKIGSFRTFRIGKSGSDGEEKTEIWLAADQYYLPVKISKTEKDGTVTERIATRLQTE